MTKSVLITGASGGIGMRLAKAMISKGYRVVLHGNRHMEAILDLHGQYPDQITAVTADISTEMGISQLTQAVGECDVVLHCPTACVS